MRNLLARYADATFWMARYIERVDSMARIIDVHETFSRDRRGEQNWASVLQLYADEERFFERYPAANAQTVPRFYIIDADNPTSIRENLRGARENARTLRPLLATKVWSHLNVFSDRVAQLTDEALSGGRLSRSCAAIVADCEMFRGIADSTFYRDEGWSFYQLGLMVERADQTTRLLDVKSHLMAPAPGMIDTSDWNVLLRTVGGYHAYRRVQPTGMSARSIVKFLLTDPHFPQSVGHCVLEIDRILQDLYAHHQLRRLDGALKQLGALEQRLRADDLDQALNVGLHELNDRIQQQLIELTNELSHVVLGQTETDEDA